MMLMLPDDLVLETFDSPENPPNSIEWMDVANSVYAFSDHRGQMYEGQLLRAARLLATEKWRLVPVGQADIKNAIALVNRAVAIDPDRCAFPDLASVKDYLVNNGGFERKLESLS
jgi:hypothetical protein